MPRVPIDYNKTIYYKIYCKDKNIKDVYISYTTALSKRKTQHKRECNIDGNKKYNELLYKHIRDNGGWNNFNISVYKVKSLKNKLEAEAKLTYYKSKLGCTF
jgi:hypothetical protein